MRLGQVVARHGAGGNGLQWGFAETIRVLCAAVMGLCRCDGACGLVEARAVGGGVEGVGHVAAQVVCMGVILGST